MVSGPGETPGNHNRDLDWLRRPLGVEVTGDWLKYLYITDEAGYKIVDALAKKILWYQMANVRAGNQIKKFVMAQMEGLWSGDKLFDRLGRILNDNFGPIEVGEVWARGYSEPGEALDKPEIIHDLNIDVTNCLVGMIKDVVYEGKTTEVLKEVLRNKGAKDIITIAMYIKGPQYKESSELIYFGQVPPDTWVITPRDRVDMMLVRVPYWALRGVDRLGCVRNLKKIGYQDELIKEWFEFAWSRIGK
jgi:hypothetical protein